MRARMRCLALVSRHSCCCVLMRREISLPMLPLPSWKNLHWHLKTPVSLMLPSNCVTQRRAFASILLQRVMFLERCWHLRMLISLKRSMMLLGQRMKGLHSSRTLISSKRPSVMQLLLNLRSLVVAGLSAFRLGMAALMLVLRQWLQALRAGGKPQAALVALNTRNSQVWLFREKFRST